MPWVIRKQGAKYCVYRQGSDGGPTGASRGCHDTRAGAIRQQRALYKNVPEEASAVTSTFALMDTNQLLTYWPTTTSSTTPITLQVTVADSTKEDSTDERGAAFEGVLAVIGAPTSDKRYLIPGEVGNRDLPIPVMVQTATQNGHMGAEICGRLDSIDYIPVTEFARRDEFHLDGVPDSATVVWGAGTFDTSEYAQDAERVMENGAGVSIDMPADRVAAFDPETLQEVPEDEVDFRSLMEGAYLVGIGGKIAAATIVSIPAFEEASIMLVPGHALVASAYGFKLKVDVLTAAAAGAAPLKPARDWFFTPEPDTPAALTVTPKGHVFGHLALWEQCHPAFATCERAPYSASDYAYFHVGEIETAEGEMVAVGRITVGNEGTSKGGHASVVLGRQGAMEHYDKSGCVAAFVRAINGKHGIWLSGAIRSDAPAERIRDLRANPPSGDWRDNELVAVLSVPVPGFPIPRMEALIASADNGEEEIKALIASGYSAEYEVSEPMDVPTYRRRLEELAARRIDGLAYTAEQRRKMAKSGEAMPDGSFPIANCADAERAIHAQGRAKNQNAAVAHIKKRVRAMGCSGPIFDNYK